MRFINYDFFLNKINIGFKLIIVLISILLTCFSIIESTNNIIKVDIESNIGNLQELSLSKFNATIEYLPLKQDDNLIFSRIRHLDILADNIILSDNNICLLYDYMGSIISRIGVKGRGPNELKYYSNIGLSQNKKIYIQSSTILFEYDLKGTYLNSYELNRNKDSFFDLPCWKLINDSLFLGLVPNHSGTEKNKAIIFDVNGNIRKEFKNYTFLKRERPTINSDDSYATFYSFRNELHFKEKMNDTLFYLSDKYEMKPKYIFELGKYSEPIKYRENPIGNIPFEYIFLNDVFEIPGFIFLDCSFGKHTSAKRVTPKIVAGQQSWYNTTKVLGVYNVKSKKLTFSKPTTTDNPLFTTGFYNDIDGGPRFYPFKQVNDSTMVMWIEAKQFKDHVNNVDFINNNPKYPERKKQLEELANSLSEFDNPVLMFVTFKKE
jgi:hypothetical protein